MAQYATYHITPYRIQIGHVCDKVVSLTILQNEDEKDNQRTAFTDMVAQELTEYLAGTRQEFTFAYHIQGTELQCKVWQALCNIPYGETRTYKQVATAIGNPKASRAVGMANNKNPLLILIPCHRVIGANGNLVGYAAGLDIKKQLLSLETVHKST